MPRMRMIRTVCTTSNNQGVKLSPDYPTPDKIKWSFEYALRMLCVGDWKDAVIAEYVEGYVGRVIPVQYGMDVDAAVRYLSHDPEEIVVYPTGIPSRVG